MLRRGRSSASVSEPEPRDLAGKGGGSRVKIADIAERLALPAAWGLLCVFYTVLPGTSHSFPTVADFASIFGSQAVIAVLALGLLIPLTAGDYDLSIAYTLSLSAMVLAVLNVNEHWAIKFAMLAAMGAALAVGIINGAFVIIFGINPFIVTLGTGTFVSGIVLWISDSNTIGGIAPSWVNRVIVDRLLGIPLEFYYALALCVIVWYVFEFTPLGRNLLIVGRGREVARLSGLKVSRIRWGALICAALVSGLAGLLYAGTTGSADPTSGSELLLPAYAAAFLGATTIIPGRFNPWGSLVAVYFLVTGITGLLLLGVPSYVQQLFYGGALVLAVTISQVLRRRRELDLS